MCNCHHTSVRIQMLLENNCCLPTVAMQMVLHKCYYTNYTSVTIQTIQVLLYNCYYTNVTKQVSLYNFCLATVTIKV